MKENDMNTAIYEQEAEQTRERIASTVDDLQYRLSPRRVVGDAVGSLQDRGSELLGSASRIVRENPTAIGLIGLSLGLLLLTRGSSRSHDSYTAEGLYDESQGYDASADEEPGTLRRGWSSVRSSVRDRVGSASSAVSDRASTARDYASEKWHSARDRSSEFATRARTRASDLSRQAGDSFDANPFLGAVVGIAAGAIVGALLPRTAREDQLLGETRDRLADAARAAARAAADAGKEQLNELGVNADAAKAKLAEVGEQAKQVARTAGQAATDEIKTRTSTTTQTA